MKKLFNKQGMTLVELVVAMTLVAIFMVSVVSVMYPFMRTYQRISTLSRQQTLANILMTDIRSRFNDVSYVKVFSGNAEDSGINNGDSSDTIVFQNVNLDNKMNIAYIITDTRLDEASGYEKDGYLSVRYLRVDDLDDSSQYIGTTTSGSSYYYYGAPETVINTTWLANNGCDTDGNPLEFAPSRKLYMGNTVETEFTILADCVQVKLVISNGKENNITTTRTEYIDLQ